MKDLSLHILDLAQNSLAAGAACLQLSVTHQQEEHLLTIRLADDGRGMDEETCKRVLDPFYTTRTTRRVGLGLPLAAMTAESTGGGLALTSKPGGGTTVELVYKTNHWDCPPEGDMAEMLRVLVGGLNGARLCFSYTCDEKEFVLDTQVIAQELGDSTWLADPQVLAWLGGYVREGLEQVRNVS